MTLHSFIPLKPLLKRSRLIGVIALVAVAFSLTVPIFAAPVTQETQAEIFEIRPEENAYGSGNEVTIEFEIRDRRDPDLNGQRFTYRAGIVVEDAGRNVIFSSDDEGAYETVRIDPGDFGTAVFQFDLPDSADVGRYGILGTLHDDSLDTTFDEWGLGEGAFFSVEQASITDIRSFDDVYASGDEVTIEVEVRDRRNPDNDAQRITYAAAIIVEDSVRSVVFNSLAEGFDRTVRLDPGESDSVTFQFDLQDDAEGGEYAILGSLHDEDYQQIFDIWELDDGASFDVEDVTKISVTPDEHDFGTIDAGDTPSRSFSIFNEGTGTLEWEVVEWPDEWLHLRNPMPGEVVSDNRGRIQVEVREDIAFGEFEDNILVESNGGDVSILVKASVFGTPDGEITRIRVQSGSSYVQSEIVEVEARVENAANVNIDYRVTLLIKNSGQTVYDSNVEGQDYRLRLEPEEEQVITFYWAIPTYSGSGDYFVTAELRPWNDYQCRIFPEYDCDPFVDPMPPTNGEEEIADTFDVRRRPPRISISPDAHGFGTFQLGEPHEARFEIENTGRGPLEWEVVGVPEWLELVAPTSKVVESGEIVVRIGDLADGGRFSGEIAVSSTAGDTTIPVSANIIGPTPTRTSTPSPTPTLTSTPTLTPTLVIPTATREPVAQPPAVFDGSVVARSGPIPEDAELVARIGDYESLPAFIEDGTYRNLVISPIGEDYLGKRIEFLLDGAKATNPVRPIYYIPSLFRTVDLVFDQVGTPGPTAVPPTATSTPVPSATPEPTATAVPTRRPSSTPTPTPTLVIVTVQPSPTPSGEETLTAIAFSESDDSSDGAGSCNRAGGRVSIWTGAANVMFFVAPIGLLLGYKRHRR